VKISTTEKSDITISFLSILFLVSFLISYEKETFDEGGLTTVSEKYNYIWPYIKDLNILLEEPLDVFLKFYHEEYPYKNICRETDLTPVPFICSSGAFGYNTFLALYFSGFAPIGFATAIQPKLHVFISSIFEAADHDIKHYGRRYCNISLSVKRSYYDIYLEILDGYDASSEETQLTKRKYLFFLFFLINEISFGGQFFDENDNPILTMELIEHAIKRSFLKQIV
jgi:hypothetical protein